MPGKASPVSGVVYYVEDDKNIRELTVYALRQAGLDAAGCNDDSEFRRMCAERRPDVILLDIMLPDADGLDILARVRHTPGLSRVPVMMLTAKDSKLDKVRALDGGADDYLSKPFGMMEPVSRTRALLRCAGRTSDMPERKALSVENLTLWPDRREATINGQPLSLTMREFDLLEFLMRSPAWSSHARRSCSACGVGTSTAGRARWTFTCNRFVRSSVTPRTSSRPSAAWATACAGRRRAWGRRSQSQ